MTPRRRVVDALLQRSLEVWHRFGTTPEPHAFAQVIPASAADATLTTGDADLKGDAVTDVEASYLWPDSNDSARGLVTERERHAGAEVAIGELLVVTDIGPADACCVDSNLKFTDAGVTNSPAFLRERSVAVYQGSG